MKKELLGHIQIDSSHIFITDIRKFVCNPAQYKEYGLIVQTKGLGNFPVYFCEDEVEGGFGNSRIIIEIGPPDSGEGYPKYVAKNKHG